MARKSSALPKLPATVKTAYQLLTFIQKVIREDPLRYDQWGWLDQVEMPRWRHNHHTYPACGTIGCVAGWAAVLTPTPTDAEGVESTRHHARRVLGLTPIQDEELFLFANVHDTPQTSEHAHEGVAHIQRFKQKYAKQLKATRL